MTREWLLEGSDVPAEVAVQMMYGAMPEALTRVLFEDERAAP